MQRRRRHWISCVNAEDSHNISGYVYQISEFYSGTNGDDNRETACQVSEIQNIRCSERTSKHVNNSAEFRLVFLVVLIAIHARHRENKTHMKSSPNATLQRILLCPSLIKAGHNKKRKEIITRLLGYYFSLPFLPSLDTFSSALCFKTLSVSSSLSMRQHALRMLQSST
jgi:hypothetical protein